MMTLLIVILVMASVKYSLKRNVLVLLYDKTSYICYHYMRKWMLNSMRIRMPHHLWMLIRNKRIDAISSKLWQCSLGHILRGRIECSVKASILPPLQFSDSEQCINCIKEKYVKNKKKGAKRGAGILEIIHTDKCGPFPVTTVDGYDSFITFTNDYSHYGYIYPIKEWSEALINLRYLKQK